MDLEGCINEYITGREEQPMKRADGRYSSFDYCYNYFYSFYNENRIEKLATDENIQMSCLQIGFYLASSGLMGRSSSLIERSIRNFQGVVSTISQMDPVLWEIDLDSYTPENVELLMECRNRIIASFSEDVMVSEAIVTRIMLGVFGNIPVFDQYFKNSMKMKKVNHRSLIKLREFYEENKAIFNSYDVHTLDFLTGKETDVLYTKARLLDIYGYMNGQFKKHEICMDWSADI